MADNRSYVPNGAPPHLPPGSNVMLTAMGTRTLQAQQISSQTLPGSNQGPIVLSKSSNHSSSNTVNGQWPVTNQSPNTALNSNRHNSQQVTTIGPTLNSNMPAAAIPPISAIPATLTPNIQNRHISSQVTTSDANIGTHQPLQSPPTSTTYGNQPQLNASHLTQLPPSQYSKSTPTSPRPGAVFSNHAASNIVSSSPLASGLNKPGTMVPQQNSIQSRQTFTNAKPSHDLSRLSNYNNGPKPMQPPSPYYQSSAMNRPPQPSTNYGSVPQPAPPPQYGPTNPNFITGPTNQIGSGPPQFTGPPQYSANQMMTGPPLPGPQYPNTNSMGTRYPDINKMQQGMANMSVTQQGYDRLWGIDNVDLLRCRDIIPSVKVEPPPIRLQPEFVESDNCSPDIFRCTLNKIPETNSLLQKTRLPLGILIHPFRDLSQLAVIQCSTIVRCRACRTYINPFVYFIDNKRWKCNLCFRANELPDEFQYDPVSKTYGDPTRRPEVKSSTIEFIAPAEYMLRPPQPALYLFVLDISRIGCETGYLDVFTTTILEELENLPGDTRTQVGFILFDSCVHFFSISEHGQAHEMIVTDIDDIFLPSPDSLLVNLNEHKEAIKDLLEELPKRYNESFDTNSALGAALQAAYKLMSPTGGRITVFQSCLPNIGPGSLNCREDPNQRAAKEVHHLGPQTDFYKRLSLDCSTQQISVDLFLVNAQYADLATLAGVSQFSGGCVYHFPLFRKKNIEIREKFIRTLRRYLTRKIGFEAVMRIRCSRGLSIHTFHGNFFVRSTDLLSLPNVNPDAGFGMQVSIEESLSDLECVCFQAALLYTSAKGERRIRVHTLCLPVSTSFRDVLTSADQQCIIGLLGKMAVDRSLKSNMSDARDALVNVAVDVLSAYKLVETSDGHSGLLAPSNLAVLPLYILALLKSVAFRTGTSTRLDDRVFAMLQMKTLPLKELIQSIHADLFNITVLDDKTDVEFEGKMVAQPPRLTLSSEQIDSRCCYLMDTPEVTFIILGRTVSPTFLQNIFGVNDITQIDGHQVDLPELDNDDNKKLRHLLNYLQSDKPWPSIIQVVNDPKTWSPYLITDRTETSLSYYEFLQHIKAQVK